MTDRYCIERCGNTISKTSTGRCKSCSNRIAYRSPEARERLAANMRALRKDEDFNAAANRKRIATWARKRLRAAGIEVK